jgi:hypothetical protein
VNAREVLFILVTIVASASGSSRGTRAVRDDIILVIVVNKVLVIVRHVGLQDKEVEVERSRGQWQVVAEGRKEV